MKLSRLVAMAIIAAFCGYGAYADILDASDVTAEVVTFVSIAAGSILAALSGLVFGTHVSEDDKTKALVDNGNRFWGTFLGYVSDYRSFLCSKLHHFRGSILAKITPSERVRDFSNNRCTSSKPFRNCRYADAYRLRSYASSGTYVEKKSERD